MHILSMEGLQALLIISIAQYGENPPFNRSRSCDITSKSCTHSSFAREFLQTISTWKVRFRYTPQACDYLQSPNAWPKRSRSFHQELTSIKRGGREVAPCGYSKSTTRTTAVTVKIGMGATITASLLVLHLHSCPVLESSFQQRKQAFFALYGIGAEGCVRYTKGARFGGKIRDWEPEPEDKQDTLYQPGYPDGVFDGHYVQMHKMLENWADRIAAAHSVVDEDEVAAGIEHRARTNPPHVSAPWQPSSCSAIVRSC
ncbi:hypothetical protein BDW71DRAFT_101788 [Aspergillus fruticulosus]